MNKLTKLILALVIFISCKKDNSQSCYSSVGKGKIIGIDPCAPFTNGMRTGSGFVIEINNLNVKDTVVTYNIPENLFQFKPEYLDGSYSSYLFRPEVQNLFKIDFKYKEAVDNEKTFIICNGSIYTAFFDRATGGKQILISCISKQ